MSIRKIEGDLSHLSNNSIKKAPDNALKLADRVEEVTRRELTALIFPLPIELTGYIFSFLPKCDLKSMSLVSKQAALHANEEEVQLAREYGYQGDDSTEAKAYLKYLQTLDFDTLVKDGVIPEDYVVRGKWSFVNLEVTLSNIQLLKAEAQAGLKVKLNEALRKYSIEGNAAACKALLQLGADIETEIVTRVIEEGAVVFEAVQPGRTPLHLAAENGKEDVVEVLIQNGANVNPTDFLGYTPLMSAIQYPVIIHLLLENGAVAVIDNLGTDLGFVLETIECNALHKAVMGGQIDTVKLLLKYGANIEIPDSDGQTPLALAVLSGNKDMVEVLIQNRANVLFAITYEGNTFTILQLATRYPDIISLLLENGAMDYLG
jgi:hypothetical protein